METYFTILWLCALLSIHGHPHPAHDEDGYHPRPQMDKTGTRPSSGIDWNEIAKEELNTAKFNFQQSGTAKNVILFVGDGMGMSTITATRRYMAETRGIPLGERAVLSFENFPGLGLSMTYNSDRLVPDSSGTATALMCGEKVNFYTIGVKDDVLMSDCTNVNEESKLKSVIKHAIDAGKRTGVVSTARITHATPAAAYANIADRNWEYEIPDNVPGKDNCQDIAQQLVEDTYSEQIRVFLGGGQRGFYPQGDTVHDGRRTDGKNLIQEWRAKKNMTLEENQFQYLETRQEMLDINTEDTEYLLGLFSTSHMSDEIDRLKVEPQEEPSLTEMVDTAIKVLKKGPDGFVLFVEGAKMDMAHHDNLPHRALNETLMLSDAVEKAMELTNKDDTLVIVTADHSHSFTVSGYPKTSESILGTHLDMQWEPDDKIPYTVLSYVNGPGWYEHRLDENGDAIVRNVSGIHPLITRKNLTGVDTADEDFVSDAGIPNDSETHAGEEVPIYSSGPSFYIFNGLHEQHFIAHGMMYAACIGPYSDDCVKPNIPDGSSGLAPGSLTYTCAALLCIMMKMFN